MNELNMQKVEAFMGKAVGDLSANFTGVMVLLGHKLGLYAGLAEGGPQDAQALASRTNTAERYVQEWLSQQAAAGYVNYDTRTKLFELPAEHALVLASGEGPAFFPPAYEAVASMWHDNEVSQRAFRTGEGVGWHEHHHSLFCGTEAFFKPGYRTHLTSEWIPALSGIEDRLKAGGRIADVGCGHGASSILMAQAYPECEVFGFDYHEESIAQARQRAKEAGVEERVHFQVASSTSYEEKDFDLICYMDSLHDMGDPIAAAKHAKQALSAGGSVLLVEPFAGDNLEENLHPVGALFYAASTVLCVPNSLSQPGKKGLGAQAGQGRLEAVFLEGGFRELRRATQTPFNLILEARCD